MRADRQRFNPGDHLLLRGCATFHGSLRLDSSDAGTPTEPVTISSYGRDRARIVSGTQSAVLVENAGGVSVSKLVVVGSGPHPNHGSGVEMVNRLNGGKRLGFIRVSGIDASGFGYAGIAVNGEAWRPQPERLRGRPDHELLGHDNQYFGVIAAGYFAPNASAFANKNVYIGPST